jgi:hypothetical protein
MKWKLIKTEVNYLLEDDKGVVIASTSLKEGINSLSKQNCDEIFGIFDVEKNLYYHKQVMNPYTTGEQSYTAYEKGFIEGFNKSMELNKDKIFSEEDMRKSYFDGYNDKDENRYFNPSKSLQQQVEIEVEVVYERDCYSSAGRCDKSTMSQCIICTPVYPLEDENGCLILRKK